MLCGQQLVCYFAESIANNYFSSAIAALEVQICSVVLYIYVCKNILTRFVIQKSWLMFNAVFLFNLKRSLFYCCS